jgi:hypothetical protein
MMAHVRPSISSGLLLVVLSLASLAGPTSAAQAAPVAPGLEGPTRKEKLEELWLDAKGESGWIRTVPMYIDDAAAEYHFGPTYCGRSHRLGAETLRALQGALAQGQPVRIDATPTGTEARRCITGVAFFAP